MAHCKLSFRGMFVGHSDKDREIPQATLRNLGQPLQTARMETVTSDAQGAGTRNVVLGPPISTSLEHMQLEKRQPGISSLTDRPRMLDLLVKITDSATKVYLSSPLLNNLVYEEMQVKLSSSPQDDPTP